MSATANSTLSQSDPRTRLARIALRQPGMEQILPDKRPGQFDLAPPSFPRRQASGSDQGLMDEIKRRMGFIGFANQPDGGSAPETTRIGHAVSPEVGLAVGTPNISPPPSIAGTLGVLGRQASSAAAPSIRQGAMGAASSAANLANIGQTAAGLAAPSLRSQAIGGIAGSVPALSAVQSAASMIANPPKPKAPNPNSPNGQAMAPSAPSMPSNTQGGPSIKSALSPDPKYPTDSLGAVQQGIGLFLKPGSAPTYTPPDSRIGKINEGRWPVAGGAMLPPAEGPPGPGLRIDPIDRNPNKLVLPAPNESAPKQVPSLPMTTSQSAPAQALPSAPVAPSMALDRAMQPTSKQTPIAVPDERQRNVPMEGPGPQRDMEWNAAIDKNRPTYRSAPGMKGVRVNQNTGATEYSDAGRFLGRQDANLAVDARIAQRKETTPIGGDYGRGLGSGIAPANLRAERDFRQGLEDLRASNRIQMAAQKKEFEARGEDPANRIVRRVIKAERSPEQAVREAEYQAKLQSESDRNRSVRSVRGLERGEAMAAARTFRDTGLFGNPDFANQVMGLRDPRGAFAAMTAKNAQDAKTGVVNDGLSLKEKEADMKAISSLAPTLMESPEGRKVLGGILAKYPDSPLAQATAGIAQANAPTEAIKNASIASDLLKESPDALLEKVGPALDAYAANGTIPPAELGITPEVLDKVAKYQPMLTKDGLDPRSIWTRGALTLFGEKDDDMKIRKKRQDAARRLADTLKRAK